MEFGKVKRGHNSDPCYTSIYAFAPFTSVNVERCFPIFDANIADRSIRQEITLVKMLFIRYTKVRKKLTFPSVKISAEKIPKFHVKVTILGAANTHEVP